MSRVECSREILATIELRRPVSDASSHDLCSCAVVQTFKNYSNSLTGAQPTLSIRHLSVCVVPMPCPRIDAESLKQLIPRYKDS